MSDFSIACSECDTLVPRIEYNKHKRDHALNDIFRPRPDAWTTGRSPGKPVPSPASTSLEDAFTCWLRANKDPLKYTTIDGQPRVADSQLRNHRRLAKQFCEQVKERIANLVHGFRGWNDDAEKICLEQIQKTLLFPVRMPKCHPTYRSGL